MDDDTIKQEIEALKEIQKRADDLQRELDKTPCAGIDCAECPARCFCYLVDNMGQWLGKTGGRNNDKN